MWISWMAILVIRSLVDFCDRIVGWLNMWIFSIRFINDGYFGVDKIGHFILHAVITFVAVLLGGSAWSVFALDSVIDLQTEYRQDRQGIGFSLLDVVYGRAGCLTVLWIMGLWSPWIVRYIRGLP